MPQTVRDESEAAELEEERRRERERELEDVRKVIETPEGLRLFRRLMTVGRVFQTTFTGNAQGYFLEGHRNLALIFLHDICEAAPRKVPDLMEREEEEQDGR